MTSHSYHLVSKSIWPLLISINLLVLLIGIILSFKYHTISGILLYISIINFIYVLICWIIDIIREGTYSGNHTNKVSTGIKIGIILFILSELMLFVSIFWSFFHYGLLPSTSIGINWPSYDIINIVPLTTPLSATLLLISAASYLTKAHHSMEISSNYIDIITNFTISILQILYFIYLQYREFLDSTFDISDSVFGSIFYFGTTFHGIHVIFAGIWLIFTLIRIIYYQQWRSHHINLLTSLWYYHFTDIVWIYLYSIFYIYTNML